MLKECQLVSIFCETDDFCKDLEENMPQPLLTSPTKGRRGPSSCISVCEIMTIQVLFQRVGHRNFKTFYTRFLQMYWKKYFPKIPSYQRFTELMSRAIIPLTLFTQLKCGKKTGIYYIDGSCLPACHIKRSKRNRVFREVAEYGRTSVGWFFGLKFHVVINNDGELMAFKITRGNVHDASAAGSLLSSLEGLAFGDKGYIGKKLFDELFKKGLKLITRKRKNMKEKMPLSSLEKQLLNQRNLIETVFDCLKHKYHVWHTRHRSVLNAMINLMAALAAYTIEPLKLSAVKLLTEEPLPIGRT
ncbi:MAG: IS982 family transposase [Legionellaceae bacterium]|nr:IS982 family transposase [Legionellaceae bacterium]